MSKKVLIRAGRPLSMVDGEAERRADVLIADSRIVAVEPDIKAACDEIIDASSMIVAPGFVDTHRHVWQTQLRTIAADWSLFDYGVNMRRTASTFYTADDAYLGNYVGALEALDAGITTLVDHCHILNTPEHAIGAAQGLKDAGIRGIFCYGTFENIPGIAVKAPDDPAWRRHTATHIRNEYFRSDDDLVRFGFAPFEAENMPLDELVDEIAFARSLGAAAISMHIGMGAYDRGNRLTEQLHRRKMLGPDLLFVHGAALTDRELDLIRESGGGVSVTPETELQMGMGFPVGHRAVEHGVRTGLGIDIVSNYSGDMFAQMRLGLQSTRALRNLEHQQAGRTPRQIRPIARDALRMATIGGAEAIHMEGDIGTIEVGKRADIILVSTKAIHMTPVIDPVAGLVMNARPDDIDTVIVGGEVKKRRGRLVGCDWNILRDKVLESSQRIIALSLNVDQSAIVAGNEQRYGTLKLA